MSLKEKVCQLFMPMVYTKEQAANIEEIQSLLKTYPVGGIIFMQGTISGQIQAYEKLQSQSTIPLLCAQDNEWGLEMRLNAMRFPRNLTLGAIQNRSLIYKLGQEIGKQCKGVGVHVNFAPVVDVNNNPNNPVINDRAFGEDPQSVAQKALMWAQGFQSQGAFACAKHFPGHGDTEIDSHFSLPIINKTISELQKLEWVPFKALIEEGIESIMVAHLNMPLISGLPTSISPISISEILKERLGFQGLIFTDAMRMKAISENYPEGESEVLALLAGNDIIVAPKDLTKSIEAIYQATLDNKISEGEINKHVLKILKAKEKLNLHKNTSLPKVDFFSEEAKKLKETLFKEAITLYKGDKSFLKLSPNQKTAFVQIGRDVSMRDSLELVTAPIEEQQPNEIPPFFKAFDKKIRGDYFFLPKSANSSLVSERLEELQKYDQIIVGIFEMNKYPKKNFGITPSTLEFLKKLNPNKISVCLFGSPYSLKYFTDSKTVLMGYENDPDAQIGCAEILIGERMPQGILPVCISTE